MIQTISPSEKSDILLLLSLTFERKLTNSGEMPTGEIPAEDLVAKSLSALNPADWEQVKTRGAFFDRLSPENRRLWQSFWLEKIRRRSHSVRLDEQIHPSQIREVLNAEPVTVQLLILRNLPVELSAGLASRLGLETDLPDLHSSRPTPGVNVNTEIVAVVRQKFLSFFAALEDVYQPDAVDKLSVPELDRFIRLLGVRETAIACRGIKSKETLAAFLNRFDEMNAKEIAENLVQFENIEPFWVAQADTLVRQSWDIDTKPDELLKELGLKLLAWLYLNRDDSAVRYTAQKLSVADAGKWVKLIAASREKLASLPVEEKEILCRRQEMMTELVTKLRQEIF